MALIRYPGSKAKLVPELMKWFPGKTRGELFNSPEAFEYREPFFGAGATGFAALERLPSHCTVWLNDKDPSIYSLWLAVESAPARMHELIDALRPTPELFYKFKEEDGRMDLPLPEIAVRKLALHRLSYSGLGYMSGGPLGGKQQSSQYNVDCRWNPQTIKSEVTRLSRLLRKFREPVRITCVDFTKLISGAPENSFIYLDPPYYDKGPQLYRYAMDGEDHALLALLLRDCRADWVLSYDDHEEIRRLYRWASIREISVKYTMGIAGAPMRPKNQEVVISPRVKS